METFIELCFHAVGESAHHETVGAIKRIPGVELLLDHTRERTWLERERFFVEEWDCRIIVGIEETTELLAPDQHVSTERDPYRTLEIGGPVKRVPSKLAELIEALDASYDIVSSGWLRFETRRYEAKLYAQLQAEITELDAGLEAEFDISSNGGLSGRVEGSIPTIRRIQRHLLGTGMVAPERVRVGYS